MFCYNVLIFSFESKVDVNVNEPSKSQKTNKNGITNNVEEKTIEFVFRTVTFLLPKLHITTLCESQKCGL